MSKVQFSGAAIYIGEHTSKKYAGLAGSFVCATGFLGVAIGTSIGSFSTASFMPDWGWRIPFFLGGITTMASYFLRRNMDETPDLKKIAEQKQIVRSPLKIVLKDWKNNLLCTIGIGACGHIFYILQHSI